MGFHLCVMSSPFQNICALTYASLEIQGGHKLAGRVHTHTHFLIYSSNLVKLRWLHKAEANASYLSVVYLGPHPNMLMRVSPGKLFCPCWGYHTTPQFSYTWKLHPYSGRLAQTFPELNYISQDPDLLPKFSLATSSSLLIPFQRIKLFSCFHLSRKF